tara:strand:+ start:88 stop:615 length:528 start_codon:yes stop_codon:yes gene_type:complete
MANKKFSEFTTKTTSATVDSIVGITGSDNVKITPANFLSPALQTYTATLGGANLPTATITGHYVNFGKLYIVQVNINEDFADMSSDCVLRTITLPASAKNVTSLQRQAGTIGFIDNVVANQQDFSCKVDKNTNTLDLGHRTNESDVARATGISFEDENDGNGNVDITIQITYLAE